MIVGCSVLTDLLLIPVAIALHGSMARSNRDAAWTATAFVGLFVALHLAVTWPNIAALITFASRFGDAAAGPERAALITAASGPLALVTSPVAAVDNIATLGIGLLVGGVLMIRSGFSRVAGWAGVAAGVLGLLAVVGGLVVPAVGLAVILASVATTVWAFALGARLLRLEDDLSRHGQR